VIDLELENARNKIDKIDQDIVKLLNERATICKGLGALKAEVYDPRRERSVLENVSSLASEAPADGVKSIYREVISMCRNVQNPTRIAFLGPEGSFSDEAARTTYGKSAQYLSCRRIKNVFSEVDNMNADLGVVPFENSLEGSINETLDSLLNHSLSIVGEIQLRIHQNLIVDPQLESVGQIERLYSHPQAIAQCDGYITQYLSNAELVTTESTARATEHVLRDRKGAAIGSRVAAELNGLKILAANIEDSPNNYTRFVVLKRGSPPEKGEKTSLIFFVENVPSALSAILNEFAKQSINITMILSRPADLRPWEYFFFLDFEGSSSDERCATTLKALKEKTRLLRILGSYSRLQ
jgi:chorismate mutase/prephenate dehydratase